MSRPCKRRRVCAMPGCGRFGPVEGNAEQRVIMSVDEFETIRLIDYEGLTQEACAERMEVARTTAQAIYAAARSKLAECLVAGMELVIEGGPYVLCDGNAKGCGSGHGCMRRCCGMRQEEKAPAETQNAQAKNIT